MRSWGRASLLLATGLVLGLALGVRFAQVAERNLNKLGYSAWTQPNRILSTNLSDRAVVYKVFDMRGQSGRLLLHIFDPVPEAPKRAKTILMVHGGRWNTGSPAHLFRQCRFLSQEGFGCISASYRTRSAHGTDPLTALRDVRDAMAYAKENLARLGLPDEEFWVAGASAGGQLALTAAATSMPEHDFEPVPVDGMILFNPVLDTSEPTRFYRFTKEIGPRFSPSVGVGAVDIPILIVNGGNDHVTPSGTARAMAARLREKGADVELDIYPGVGHGFFAYARFAEVNERMLGFLSEN